MLHPSTTPFTSSASSPFFHNITLRTKQIEDAIANLSACATLLSLTQSGDRIQADISILRQQLSYKSMESEADNQQLNQWNGIISEYPALLRARMLICKAMLDKKSANARKMLLGDERIERQRLAKKETAADKSLKLTSSLEHTRDMLAGEVSRSAITLERFRASTSTISSTSGEAKRYAGALRVGDRLLTQQQRRAKTDRALLALSVLFFCLVVVYIITKRLRLQVLTSYILGPFTHFLGNVEDEMP